ncbi:MAG: CU044_2847 family protein [Cyanobacteria bacterium P01_D01_bin.56]
MGKNAITGTVDFWLFMALSIQTVPVELDDGSIMYVKVEKSGPTTRSLTPAGLGPKQTFQAVSSSIENIVKAVAKPINAAKPSKASVTFGVEVEVQEGQLIAALAKGGATTSLEITLEWEKGE